MTDVIIERDVSIPMRDGVVMQADIWRPGDGERHPVLLQRTPYNRADSFAVIVNSGIEPLRAVGEGFVVAISDTRGRFGSAGRFDPFRTEAADGYDTVQWLAAQPYCNDRVGMYGSSYFAATQLLAATQRPPALKAIAPQVTASDYHDTWTYYGGALQLGFALYWALGLAAAELVRRQAAGEPLHAESAALASLLADPAAAFRHRPLEEIYPLDVLLPAWSQWIAHPTRDEFWRAVSIADQYTNIDLPALHIGGWFDLFLRGTVANFTGMAEGGAQQRLIIGPWAHAVCYDALGEVGYGPSAAAAALDMTRVQLDWFAEHLMQRPPREPAARVSLFVMGENVWRDEEAFPPARAVVERWYLRSAPEGGGRLDRLPPPADGGCSRYRYDPQDPVPTVGGSTFLPGVYVGFNAGQRDQRGLETRPDVLVFTGPVLDRPVEICGPISVLLHAATDAADTDWTAKLCYVAPGGRVLNICDGIVRARYGRAEDVEQPVEPGEVAEFTVDLGATCIVIPSGCALRLHVSSSNFPRFDANPNVAGPVGRARTSVVARQQIWHSADRPSALLITTVPRD